MEKILEASRDAGAVGAGYVMLRLPWEVKELFREWLDAHFPDRADHVMSLMRQLHGGAPQHRARETVTDPDGFNQEAVPEPQTLEPDAYRRNEYYSAQWHVRARGSGPLADLVEKRFRLACRRLGLKERRLTLDASQFRVPPASGDQLGLDF
jgi:DNA repair photolyase